MTDRPDWAGKFDNKGNEITPSDAPKSHEQIIAEMNAYPNVPATAPPAAAVPAPAKDDKGIVRADWGNPSQEVAPAGEQIIGGLGYGQSLMNRLASQPDGFEANDARLLESAFNTLEAQPDPDAFATAFDLLPASLQTKALEVQWAYGGTDIEKLYAKLKGKLTLEEAAAAERFIQQMRKK
jgi:hypothetical protein